MAYCLKREKIRVWKFKNLHRNYKIKFNFVQKMQIKNFGEQ